MDLGLQLSRTHLPIARVFRHAWELPERTAIVEGDFKLTFREFWERIQAAAARLADSGVVQGDRVAIVAGNSAAYPVLVYAINYLGAIVVPVNFRLAAGEIGYILGDCEPKVVIADAERETITREAAADASVQLLQAQQVVAPGVMDNVPELVVRDLTDDQAIMYTSGTTGRPKGAVLTYANFHATIIRTSNSWNIKSGQDGVLIASPMFHIAAFNVLLGSISNAGKTVITPSTNFDAGFLLDVMEEHGVTRTFMVPAQWQLIAEEQRRKPRNVTLGFYSWGAAPATESLLTMLREAFPEADSQAAFGQTETTATGVTLSHEDSLRKLGSVGLPDVNYAIRVVDPEMNDVPRGEVGEIVYRGPGVMDRFWNNPEATAEAFAGGWFHSGDLVRQDDEGFIYVVDRVKDMIISGGENIYCAELENVIAWHPKVADVAVVGRPDDKWGEVPVAVIVPHDQNEAPTLEEIREFCDGKLARYKHPKDVVLRGAFPRSGTGKIRKTDLRDEV